MDYYPQSVSRWIYITLLIDIENIKMIDLNVR